ncbi:type I-F CRISPR-associated endoribonuclease Cas6/Csy4 [Pseudoalteromonas ruthenica]|uniref:type I-F CRISPR-associated endoribonuclease Cas6/Csy4 n=1 Tax=Pseudoalteromonas ruthenica TaxID=151081 RepID=UPI00110A73F1|nr:type I-F CRISPR-associated endoribonuclease Cas6/Csy4 [Pseudoalteromonas ruthenica]TMO85502.1 type I-F CRISPR-associated endoribonuclease Cas6/Csy4 [Pseudoalteromonas ruthenica]TMP22806.1 type I-F CRISPR-associated endoribonuclease Cas6/Csy4 [Pseudoalteromonas ruthenica]USN27126.1 type I-F CRISPR-associated endoribonuclease Cas6/Csy4 [synthetic construct]
MKRSYFTVTYLPINCDYSLLAGRCIGILHGYLSRFELDGIGVSFPKWNEETVGNQIAFVSESESHLQTLRQQNYFQMMSHDGLFKLSVTRTVPEQVDEIQFVRNQSISKAFVGERRRRMVRAKLRAEARGEEYNPIYEFEPTEIEHFHSIPITSKSNNNEFVLHIQRRECSGTAGGFNKYGFATNEHHLGTVPSLSGLLIS